jgi:hypothetical protein
MCADLDQGLAAEDVRAREQVVGDGAQGVEVAAPVEGGLSSIASTRVGSVKTAAEARNPSPRPFAEMLPVLGAAG